MYVPTSSSCSSLTLADKIEKNIIDYVNENQVKLLNKNGFEIPLEKFLDETIRREKQNTQKQTIIVAVITGILVLLGLLFFFFFLSRS